MRQQDYENECWGLVKEEGLRSKVGGLKLFCEGDRRVLEFVVGGVFDSIYSCNGDKFFDAYYLVVKIPGFFILKNPGIFM